MRRLIDVLAIQRGPMGPNITQSTGLLLILGVVVAILSVIIILTWFPRLTGVRPSMTIEPQVVRREGDNAPTDIGGAPERETAFEVALRLLEPDEIRIVEAVKEAEGSMLQKDISYQLGLSRVRTHRILVRLIKRGVVSAEKYHNTNRIDLADWLLE
jgi:uncharacterized membrane protein